MSSIVDVATTATDRPPVLDDRSLLGHPRGLGLLFVTEMWERFSYYGMRAILVLYLVNALKWDTAHAANLYGTYTMLVFLTPVIGGYLADRFIGTRRSLVIGAIVISLGHFTLAFPGMSAFYVGLSLIIIGTGFFKSNVSTMVGQIYREGDPRRDSGFTIFYMGINLGAFLGPLVCGGLAQSPNYGWHYGFAAAGVGMLIGLATYLYAAPTLPPDRITPAAERAPLTHDDRRMVGALLVLFVPTTFFWATYEQQGNTIALWADAYTDRTIQLFGWSAEIPTTLFQSFNPFMIFAFTPLVVTLWAWQAKRGVEPSTLTKMALGCFGVTASNLIMAAAAFYAGGGKASWLWLFAYFVVITLGELYISPIGLSLVSKLAPAKIISMMMGVWLATSFTGNFIAGYLGSFWSQMDKAHFFLMIAAIAGLAGASIAAFNRPLRAVLKE
jgi:POT family proton-dependent oligopeptide transporter